MNHFVVNPSFFGCGSAVLSPPWQTLLAPYFAIFAFFAANFFSWIAAI